jgi:hypothetical protein
LLGHFFFHLHAMTPPPLRLCTSLLALHLLAATALAANLNYSGEALTTRFWDCCKPSCAWTNKASFSQPVKSCSADDKPIDFSAGTGCNGGSAFLCSDQQPWAINDTLSYGFAGAFITPDLTGGGIEGAWCCACYQLDFTSDPLRGKSMIVQASNTAYDLQTQNRFTLAVRFSPPLLLLLSSWSSTTALNKPPDSRWKHDVARWVCAPVQRRTECLWTGQDGCRQQRRLCPSTRAAPFGLRVAL